MSSFEKVDLGTPTMKSFSGNDKGEDPEDFILKMKLQIELRFIPEEVRVTFIATHLEEKALKWYLRLDHYTKKDIKLFEKAFFERFPPRVRKESVMDNVQKYLNLRQSTSVQNYNERFRDLVSLLPDNLFSPQAHLIIYTLGLKKIIGYEVSQRNISNLEEAMETAARYEAATGVQEKVFRRPRKFGYPEVKALDRETRVFLMQATVKPYSGNKNPRKIKAFIEEIFRISEGFNLNDSQLITIAGRNMTGKAETWYLEHYKKNEDSYDTFSQFTQELERQFCEEYDRQFHAERMMNLRQNGRIEAFNNHFDTLLKELPADYCTEELKLDMYLSQLKPNIKRVVKCKNLTNLNSGMRIALLYDDQYNNSTYHKNKQTFKNLNPKENVSNDRDMDKIELDHMLTRRNFPTKLECYNCGKEGHFAAKCTNRSKN